MKIYEIEHQYVSRNFLNDTVKYRFHSLYNSCKGNWHTDEIPAEVEGEQHQKIIEKALGITFNDKTKLEEPKDEYLSTDGLIDAIK